MHPYEKFQSQHFDASTCQVSKIGVSVTDVLGIELDDDVLVGLSGAPSESKITVEVKSDWSNEVDDGEDVPPGILLTVHNSKYLDAPSEVVLFLDGMPSITSVYIKLIMFKGNPALKGIAGHMVSRIVNATQTLRGARRLRLWAAGGLTWDDISPGVRWFGYMAWPKYGFDSRVPGSTKALFPHFPRYPSGLATCQSVSDVLKIQGGKEFWSVAGDGGYMTFDLAKDSASRQTLQRFLNGWEET